MRILDKYINKALVISFIGCVFVFMGLFIIIDIFTHLDDFLKQKVALSLVLDYYLTYMPTIFVQVSAYCVFLATIYTFARLNRDNELIAMRASGQSIWQITKNVIAFGIILSFFVFMVNEKIVPKTQVAHDELTEKVESGNKKSDSEEIKDLTLYGIGNRLIYATTFYPARNTLEQLNILEHDDKQNVISKVVAQKAVWKEDRWIFYKCLVYDFYRDGELKREPIFFEEKEMTILESPQKLLQQRQRIELMDTAQLRDYISRISKSGATEAVRNLKVDLHQKFSSPLSCLVLIFLGIPFSFTTRKRMVGISSLGIFVAISFLYYLFSVIGIALGKEGFINPFLAGWLAPIIFLGLSAYLIQKFP